MTKPKPVWRMEAFDQEGEPIIGPWETRAEAEKRKTDTVDGHFIRKAKVTRQK